MLTIKQRRERFREILSRDEITRPASIYDAISARLAEDAGFDLGILSGSVANQAILGAPDLALATLSEVAEQARRISRGSSLPFWIDADHGYGNAFSVMRTIEDLEAAGASAVSIEDTHLPRPFGGTATALISIDEFSGKLCAAVRARQDPSFVVIGRTASFDREGMEAAKRRIESCNEAGVDCIHIAGRATPDELQALASVTNLPIIANGEIADSPVALACGVRIAEWNHVPFSAVINTLRDSYAYLLAGGAAADLQQKGGASTQLTRVALSHDHYDDAAHQFLGGA